MYRLWNLPDSGCWRMLLARSGFRIPDFSVSLISLCSFWFKFRAHRNSPLVNLAQPYETESQNIQMQTLRLLSVTAILFCTRRFCTLRQRVFIPFQISLLDSFVMLHRVSWDLNICGWLSIDWRIKTRSKGSVWKLEMCIIIERI